MKCRFAIWIFPLLLAAACDGEFSKEETDRKTDVPDKNDSESTSSTDTADENGLPTDCETGDRLCHDDAIMGCLQGNWITVMNCTDTNLVCTEESGEPNCVSE